MTSPRVTAQDATNREPHAFEGSVLLNSLNCILRTSGGEATSRWGKRRDKLLIEANWEDEQTRKHILILIAMWLVPDGVALQRDGAG